MRRLLNRDRSSLGNKAKADLPAAGQLDVNLGEKLRIEQRTMLHPVASVDPEAHAKASRLCLAPGCFDRASASVSIIRPIDTEGRPQRSSSRFRNPKSKLALWAMSGSGDEVEQPVRLLGEPGLVGQEDRRRVREPLQPRTACRVPG
jgi:hypothetical protein